MHNKVEDHVLEAFITGKYHWKGLTPNQQKSLAVEVSKLRYIVERQYRFAEELLEHREAAKKYRQLVAGYDSQGCAHYFIVSPSGEEFCINCGESNNDD